MYYCTTVEKPPVPAVTLKLEPQKQETKERGDSFVILKFSTSVIVCMNGLKIIDFGHGLLPSGLHVHFLKCKSYSSRTLGYLI